MLVGETTSYAFALVDQIGDGQRGRVLDQPDMVLPAIEPQDLEAQSSPPTLIQDAAT